jgi:hypothetical protein
MPTFPDFYTECAYMDGLRSVRDNTPETAASYMRHGSPEPIGMAWFKRGAAAARVAA